MRLLHAVLLASLSSCFVFGQTYTIKTVAGGALPENILGTSAKLGYVGAVTLDKAGNVFLALTEQGIVLRIDSAGLLTRIAGNGSIGFSGDNGPAISAQLGGPRGLAVDTAGSLYIADYDRVRKVANGVITSVAGNGTFGFSGDNGQATNAQLAHPTLLGVAAAGNLYIGEYYGVRKVSNGVITTVAGNGTFGFIGGNGPTKNAQLSYPSGVALRLP